RDVSRFNGRYTPLPRLATRCTVSAQALTSKADLDTTFTKIKRDTYTGSSTYKSE
ncbi:MAG: hypothetical protein ACI9DF_004522, partial [Verrucomicrobiales bacterium]